MREVYFSVFCGDDVRNSSATVGRRGEHGKRVGLGHSKGRGLIERPWLVRIAVDPDSRQERMEHYPRTSQNRSPRALPARLLASAGNR